MDAVTETTTVSREVEIAAKPETIWKLLVDPKEIVRWMGSFAEFDLRKGGRYRLDVVPGHKALGTFTEIDPPHRLAYTFGWEGNEGVPPGSSTVIFELIPRGSATLLRFTHRDLPNAAACASHAEGWDHYFARLAIVAKGGNAGVDAWMKEKAK